MPAHDDLGLAQKTSAALKQLRSNTNTSAAQMATLTTLAHDIQVPAEPVFGRARAINDVRASAWLAICKVAVTLKDAPGDPQLGLHWARAVDATDAWVRALEK